MSINTTIQAMRLHKDFLGGRVVYFWKNHDNHQQSPFFATFQFAQEWWDTHVFIAEPASKVAA